MEASVSSQQPPVQCHRLAILQTREYATSPSAHCVWVCPLFVEPATLACRRLFAFRTSKHVHPPTHVYSHFADVLPLVPTILYPSLASVQFEFPPVFAVVIFIPISSPFPPETLCDNANARSICVATELSSSWVRQVAATVHW